MSKILSIEEAINISREYVQFNMKFSFDLWNKFNLDNIKKNQMVLVKDNDGFKIVKVTSVNIDMAGEPKVRVTDGVFSWRIEHCCKINK